MAAARPALTLRIALTQSARFLCQGERIGDELDVLTRLVQAKRLLEILTDRGVGTLLVRDDDPLLEERAAERAAVQA